MNYLLETDKLTKIYGKQKAVNEVNVHLEKGAIYGFIGRNGAGKTTFLKMICGMAKPTSGNITLFGKNARRQVSIRKATSKVSSRQSVLIRLVKRRQAASHSV